MKQIIEIPDGNKTVWKDVKERVKTLEDACGELGETNALVQAYRTADFNIRGNPKALLDVIAYLKLRIISAALNEGWKPQFTEDESRWHPCFRLWSKEELEGKSDEWKANNKLWMFGGSSLCGANCSLACAFSYAVWSPTDVGLSARLAVKSEELAEYFGEQFIDIWADFLLA